MNSANPSYDGHHKVLIVGGGSAGLTLAARLRRSGLPDVAVLEPSASHYYQPLWTLVGGGRAPQRASVRPQARVMPKGVTWIRGAAAAVDPAAQQVTTESGQLLGYDYLVMAPGLQLDFDRVPGLSRTLGQRGVPSNYRYDLAPQTWEFIRGLRSGTALFTMPAGPVKCAGGPAEDRVPGGRLVAEPGRTRPRPGHPRAADRDDVQPARLGEGAHRHRGGLRHRGPPGIPGRRGRRGRQAGSDRGRQGGHEGRDRRRMSAPNWVKASPLADSASPFGYVRADKHTLRHPEWPNVFALGDVASLPTSKTGAAIRKQSPVVAANLLAAMHGGDTRSYDGYTPCPLVTSRNKLLLAEFNYDLERRPSIPFIDTLKPRRDMYLLKRHGLPALY